MAHYPSDIARDPARPPAFGRMTVPNAAETMFGRLTSLVSKSLRVPVAFVWLADDEQQPVKGRVGLPEAWASQPLAFCQRVTASGERLLIADAREHPLFDDHAAALESGLIAYAGVPLLTSAGQALGAVCVIDRQPRAWRDDEVEILENLVAVVMSEIELRLASQELARSEAALRRQTQSLQESEQRFRALIEHSSFAIALLDAHRTITYASPATTRLLGYAVDEIVGRNALALVHPDDIEQAARLLIDLTRNPGAMVTLQVRLQHKDGSWRWIEGVGTNLLAEPDVRAIIFSYRDFTAREQAEVALRESEARNRSLLDAIPDLMLRISRDGTVLDYLASKDEEEAAPAHEFLTRTLHEAMPPELARQFMHFVERALQTDDIPIFEYRLPAQWTSGGAARDYEARLVASGKDEVVALVRDFTERKRAEEELRELYQSIADEHSRLQALITSSRDGIILIGLDRFIRVINAPALQLLRLPGQPADWLNRPLAEALRALRRYAPAIVRAARAEIRRLRTGDEPPGEGEAEVGARVIHWLNLPVLAGSAALGRLLVLYDVTEERLLEKMRDDLTHTMVHDLRSPLTSIRGALRILEQDLSGSLSPYGGEMLHIALHSTQRMVDLVGAILDISRLESGQMPLNREPIALRELVVEAFQLLAPLAAEKNLRLDNHVPSDLPPALADAGLIRRVAQNLVGNAIKFTPSGGHLQVAAEAQADSAELRVAVSDTGPGIPAEIVGRLFQKFVTGRQSERGSGLGLAFCRLAIEAHGGRIWVESQPGQGATFCFTLPVEE